MAHADVSTGGVIINPHAGKDIRRLVSAAGQTSDAVKIGTSVEDAMWATSARLDIPEFKFFVISLAIQRETGGNLTETLSNLAEILRKRRQMKLKVKAMSGEAKASAMIIGSLMSQPPSEKTVAKFF